MRIVSIGIAHCALLSCLHEDSFAEAWSSKAFQDLVAMPASFGYLALDQRDDPMGFILCQGDKVEAEIITIATRKSHRRQGVAHKLLGYVCAQTDRLFLEVARDNQGAYTFYLREGFEQIAIRNDYYKRTDGRHVDALVMQKTVV